MAVGANVKQNAFPGSRAPVRNTSRCSRRWPSRKMCFHAIARKPSGPTSASVFGPPRNYSRGCAKNKKMNCQKHWQMQSQTAFAENAFFAIARKVICAYVCQCFVATPKRLPRSHEKRKCCQPGTLADAAADCFRGKCVFT